MSPSETRAIRWLLVLGAAGVLVRFGSGGPSPPGAVGYSGPDRAGPSRDSIAARSARLARPLRPGERVDLDVAPAEEISRLPRIGPGLAVRIVQDRERNGAFGSLEGLDRVPGVGPSLLDAVQPHVTFSRGSGGSAVRWFEADRTPRPADPANRRRSGGVVRGPAEPVSLSTASAEALAHVPGIGPRKAAAIVKYRDEHGPFSTVDDLDSVPGFGSVLVRRVAPFVAP